MRKPYFLIATLATFFSILSLQLISNSGGAPSGRAGSPIDVGTCAAPGCHNSFAVNSGNASLAINTTIPETGYLPGETYTVTVEIAESGTERFGFEATAFGPGPSATIGNVVITDANRTRLNPGANQYVTHTSNGIDNLDAATWNFDWEAPAAGTGEVQFYVAAMASNRNGSTSGDHVYTIADTLAEAAGASIEPLEVAFEARLFPTLASDQITLQLQSQARSSLRLWVNDLQGRQVYTSEAEVMPGAFNETINLSRWQPGLYVLSLELNGQRAYRKFVVKRN
jgi:hypothetical protein